MTGMGHDPGSEQAMLVRTVADFARAEITPRAQEMDEHPEFNDIMKIIEEAGEFGMLAALLPPGQGGEGMDLHTFLLAMVEMARESAAVAALLLSHNLALKALELAELKRPEGAAAPGLACLGMPAHLHLGGAGSVVSGTCDFVPGLPLAREVVLVGEEREVVSVRLDGEGSEMREEFSHGLHAARPGTLALSQAPVVWHGTLGAASFGYLLASLCLGVTAVSAGIIAKGYEVARAYAKERYQGGDIIERHQQVRLMLAEMKAGMETACSTLAGACGRGGDYPSLPSALAAKAVLCERAFAAASDAVQLHGGYGYMRDYGMERLMRDAAYLRIWPFSGQEALLLLLDQD
jgi:alkylation response protein AidB-like acyl-CoA dehydrogenase